MEPRHFTYPLCWEGPLVNNAQGIDLTLGPLEAVRRLSAHTETGLFQLIPG